MLSSKQTFTQKCKKGNIVPSIAESWEPNPEITSWVFQRRKVILFHNGREVDAEAVKLNILCLALDPASSRP